MTDQEQKEMNAIRTFTEKYLCTSILSNDILTFLQEKLKNIKSVSNLLAEKAGKDPNSIYKNKNELTIYSAPSFLRYWFAMINICKENDISNITIPSLDELLIKYAPYINLLNQINGVNDLKSIVNLHADTLFSIILYYKNHSNGLNEVEKKTLNLLETIEPIKQKVNERTNANLKNKIERMNKIE